MSGTTAGGWPYVTPDDHPKEFPAHSQALAQKLDAMPASKLRMGTGSYALGSNGTAAANSEFGIDLGESGFTGAMVQYAGNYANNNYRVLPIRFQGTILLCKAWTYDPGSGKFSPGAYANLAENVQWIVWA